MYEVAHGSQFCSKGINVCRESIFLLLQKQPDQLGTIFFLALLMEKLRMCKPPAQGHAAKKVWNQPFTSQ